MIDGIGGLERMQRVERRLSCERAQRAEARLAKASRAALAFALAFLLYAVAGCQAIDLTNTGEGGEAKVEKECGCAGSCSDGACQSCGGSCGTGGDQTPVVTALACTAQVSTITCGGWSGLAYVCATSSRLGKRCSPGPVAAGYVHDPEPNGSQDSFTATLELPVGNVLAPPVGCDGQPTCDLQS